MRRPHRAPDQAGSAAGQVRWFIRALPLLMLLLVSGLTLANREWTVLELAVLSPMLAATFAGPPLTALYGVLAVLDGVLLGLHDDLFGQAGGGPTAQAVRLGGVALGGVLAVLASRYNTRRETKLQNVSRVAEVAQQSILTPVPPSSGTLRLAARYASATAEARIGGDLYEVLDTPWGTRLIIGDVRGKGLGAVRIASRVLGCFRLVARQAYTPFALLTALDVEAAVVCGLDDFVTAVVVQIDNGQVDDHRLTLVNAGHPDPLLVRDGHAHPLNVGIRLPPLGLLAGDDNTVGVTLQPGDRLLFYTDGISEARHPDTGQFFPLLPQVEAAFADLSPDPGAGYDHSLDDAVDDLARRVRAWTHATLSDDVALLAVELPRTPP